MDEYQQAGRKESSDYETEPSHVQVEYVHGEDDDPTNTQSSSSKSKSKYPECVENPKSVHSSAASPFLERRESAYSNQTFEAEENLESDNIERNSVQSKLINPNLERKQDLEINPAE